MNYFTIYNFIKSHLKDVRLYLVGLSLASLSLFMAVRFFPSYFYKVFPPNIYLILHGLAEIFSIIISLQIFILAWVTYKQTQNARSLFIGVSFLGVAILDTFHLFSFPGMPGLFTAASTHKAIYFWLGARLWAVWALLAGCFLPTKNNHRLLSPPSFMGAVLSVVALIIVIDVYLGPYIPALYIEGVGLTPLKITLEWVVMALALVAFLFYGREYLKKREESLLYLMTGLILTIISEMCFTFYASAFDTYNLLGHVYKFTAYGLFFHALFIAEIRQPYLSLEAAHRMIAESERRFRTLLENVELAVVELDNQGNIAYMNPFLLSLTGYSKEEVLGKNWFMNFLGEEDRPREKEIFEKALLEGLPKHFEGRILTRPGELRSIVWNRTVLKSPAGESLGIMRIGEDITERKRSEEQVRKLSQVVEQSPAIIAITDIKGNIEWVNPRFTQVTGYTFEEVRGQNPRILKSGHTPPEEYKHLWDTITEGGVWRGEFYNKKKNGEYYWESAAIASIKITQGVISHFFKVAEDITERKHLEAQLLQSQKLEAVGTLAGGVAHDFNNLLTAIIGNIELAKFKSKDPTTEPYLEEIESIANRAALLTRQLLAFSRRQLLYPQLLNLNDTVTHMSKMLTRLIGEHIELDFKLEDKLGMVKADPGQIEQVIMNLCVNARDVMPQGGRLVIETQNTILDESYIEGHPWVKSGDHVMLAVTDTGSGMNEATRARIFEPFFTTKEVGKGTGLGLSMVYGIVKQHQGYINVYSEPGYGTTFKIYLPCCEEKVAAAAKVVEEVSEVVGGKETVLLAEDEDSLREAIQNILEMYGYKVLAAKDGQEAVELYELEKEKIDLAILDAVMPKMGGRQVAEFIYRSKPAQKILFSSGYSADGIHEAFIIPGEMHFIQKPYRGKDLAQKVREVLDA